MKGLTFLSGASVGAGLMYLMDPDRGERRRAELRGTITELGDSEMMERAVEQARKLEPMLERARRLEPLAAVRGLDVNAMLEGPARMLEQSGVLEGPAHWWSHASRRPEMRRGAQPLQRGAEWMGLRRRRRASSDASTWAWLGGLIGAAVVGIWLVRRRGEREGFETVRSVTIEAPVERVYEFWNDFENFPRFMAHVREVRRLGGDRTHWVVAGPGGVPVEWDAMVTQRAPNDSISWRTVDGALVDHSGTVRFRPAGPSATRLEVRMTYRPVGGALGHGVAALFGRDPEHAIDEDLARLSVHLRGPRPAVGETGSRR